MYKFIFNIGKQLRNPSLTKHLKFLKQSENWSLDELESYQLKQLKELLITSLEHSEYYKKKFEGVNVHNINSLSDLKSLPVLSKKELLQFNKEIHTNKAFKKLFKANTSGTSGESLNFMREESADSFNRASIFRGYSWYGVQPWEKNGYFWGFNFSKFERVKTKYLDVLQNRFRLFSYDKVDLRSFYNKLQKSSYLHGYSSMIYNVAKFINNEKLPPISNLKMVKGTSEKIYESYQSEVLKAFGKKMISEYGAAETGIIAFECPQGNMHINMEGVLVEEENNEIIVTNLQMHSFPVIRYKLGDYISLDTKTTCSCGLQHPILKEVTGRVGTIVYGLKNEYPSLYFYYIFKNLAKKKGTELTYQVEQKVKGKLLVKIEQNITEETLNVLKMEFSDYFKNDIFTEINLNAKIISEKGKLKSFISNL